MIIVNFIGHGFQWVREHEPNPAPFPIGVNTVIRLYVNAGILYGAENTPQIIAAEREGNMANIVEHFEHGGNCPELLLIKDGGAWNDVIAGGRFSYLEGAQLLNIAGHSVRIREIAVPGAPREFALSPEENNQIFSLSWLAAHIRAIMTQHAINADQDPPGEADEIILRWLVCRQELEAANPGAIPDRLNDLWGEPGRFDELVR